MYIHKAYLIETLTNTHVGSGDATYGIADMEIQKDLITSIPVFHSSSVKGSIKDHFRQYVGMNRQPKGSCSVKLFTFNSVFGSNEPHDIDEIKQQLTDNGCTEEEISKIDEYLKLLKNTPKNGLVKFYDAKLLTLPLRSSMNVYYNCTSPSTVIDYLTGLIGFNIELMPDQPSMNEEVKPEKEKIENLIKFFKKINSQLLNAGDDKDFIVFGKKPDSNAQLMIEEFEKGRFIAPPANEGAEQIGDKIWKEFKYDEIRKSIQNYLAPYKDVEGFINTLAIFSDEVFKEICEMDLPVIPRNCLEKDNENLFYEEVLPRRSVLWFMTGTYHIFTISDNNDFLKTFNFFENKMLCENIQMGANASIGYGVTSISRIMGGNHE